MSAFVEMITREVISLDLKVPEIMLPQFKMPNLSEPVNTPGQNLASEFYKKIIRMIKNFDARLDATEQVGVRLVTFGKSVTFQITDVGYDDPSLIMFTGNLDDGSPVTLIQHVSQISFLLMAVKRQNPEEPKRPIGFQSQ